MAGNRCPDCNKFVSLELEDEPEVEVVQCEDTGDGKAILTLTVILNKVCAECGTALKIGQTDVDVEIILKDIEFQEAC